MIEDGSTTLQCIAPRLKMLLVQGVIVTLLMMVVLLAPVDGASSGAIYGRCM